MNAMGRDDVYEAVFTVDGETDMALMLRRDDGEQGWVPLSQIHEIHREGNNSARVVMSAWIARKKGFIE